MAAAPPPGGGDRPPPLGLTDARTGVVAALTGGFVTFLGAASMRAWVGHLPALTVAVPILLGVLAVGVGLLALDTWRRFVKEEQRMASERGVALLAIAKAAVVGGCAVVGGLLVLVALSIDGLPAPNAWDRVLLGGLGALAAAGMTVAGVVLERSCRLPPDDPESPSTETGDAPA